MQTQSIRWIDLRKIVLAQENAATLGTACQARFKLRSENY